jgi:hypothetical protein
MRFLPLSFEVRTTLPQAPFQSLQQRSDQQIGIILPLCKIAELLDFRALNRK